MLPERCAIKLLKFNVLFLVNGYFRHCLRHLYDVGVLLIGVYKSSTQVQLKNDRNYIVGAGYDDEGGCAGVKMIILLSSTNFTFIKQSLFSTVRFMINGANNYSSVIRLQIRFTVVVYCYYLTRIV